MATAARVSEYRDESRNVATGDPIEVLPGIYEVRDSLLPVYDTPDCWVSLWILVDPSGKERPSIVDTGVPRSTETVILPALASLGIPPRDLAVAVNTHFHRDHAGSNVPLREATGCQIWIHGVDGPELAKQGTYGPKEVVLPHQPDRLLDDGEVVRLAGSAYQVAHIPGHSAGSIGLYDRERKVFLSGDGLQGQGTITQGIASAQDREGYYASLDRVAALPIEHLLAAHPYLPFTGSYVHPQREVARFLSESRRFFDEIDGEIMTALAPVEAPSTTAELAARICASRGFSETCPLAPVILRGYLSRLEGQGTLRRQDDGAESRWMAA
jgi:glyoxylase-like metal-dependent hydrolase (beta-lactamase superfamily II)